VATGLTFAVWLDMLAKRFHDSAADLRELLQLTVRTGSWVDVLNGLDLAGHLCAATGRAAEAVTIWAALTALVRQEGFTEPSLDTARRDKPLREARQALGEIRARAAEDRGATMSLATAAEYALMLTDPGSQPEAPPELARLSARERELVTLVARGHTDAQIAEHLYISIRTVRSHLERIRDKTGYRRRADLTRLALAAGLV
jgi:DNA-binding CsgD family transcriptional regulator